MNKKQIQFLCRGLMFGLASIVVCSLLTGAYAATPASTVAQVNGKAITLDYLNKKYDETVRFGQGQPPTKKSVLEDLIKREVGIQEAIKQGLGKDPEVVDRTNTVLFNFLIEKNLGKAFEKIDVSDSEAKSYYDKHPEIRTSQIFVAAPRGISKEVDSKALERIRSVEKQIKEGKIGFPEAAQQFSDGAEAPLGGDTDYLTRDRLDPTYYDAALALGSAGKVSAPVKTAMGYHLIKLTAIRPWGEADVAKVKRLVFENKRKDMFDKFINDLKAKAKVTINASLLE